MQSRNNNDYHHHNNCDNAADDSIVIAFKHGIKMFHEYTIAKLKNKELFGVCLDLDFLIRGFLFIVFNPFIHKSGKP